jgi:hypothetical protein
MATKTAASRVAGIFGHADSADVVVHVVGAEPTTPMQKASMQKASRATRLRLQHVSEAILA